MIDRKKYEQMNPQSIGEYASKTFVPFFDSLIHDNAELDSLVEIQMHPY